MNADQIAELQNLAWPAEILAKYLHTEPNKIRADLEAGTWHIKGQSVDYATTEQNGKEIIQDDQN